MIIKSFKPIVRPENEILFRGRSCDYWKQCFFNISEINLDNDTEHFDYLIIFDPHKFFSYRTDRISNIITYLLQSNPEKELIVSIEKLPFFAISHSIYQKLKKDFKEVESIIKILKNSDNLQIIPAMNIDELSVFEIQKDFRLIEESVINYQISFFNNAGIFLEDFNNFYIEGLIPIGEGSSISTGVVIKGNSQIGQNVKIYPNCFIDNSTIADNCILLPGSILTDSTLEENVQIGPYTHLRNGSLVKQNAKMGNFVEMKKSILGEYSKAMHLSYIGDAEVGTKVNVGAGTITCNYDGVNKNKTIIGDGVFIGSGTELVAPVTLEKNSYVAAGSTITEKVPENSLAVARQKQRNISEWVTRKKIRKICNP